MDFNEMFENEVKCRVQEEVSKELTKRDAAFYQNLKHKLIAKINEIFDEEVNTSNKKCDYPNCKNYGDGTIDDLCKKCDSCKIKAQEEKKRTENLKDSAAGKTPLQEAVSDIVEKKDDESKQEETDGTNDTAKKTDELIKKTTELLKEFVFDMDNIKAKKLSPEDEQIVQYLANKLF